MKNLVAKCAVLALSFSLVACSSTNTQSQNTTAGAVTGAVIGGLAGSAIGAGTGQVVAIGVGAVAGALVGGTIGHNMDSSDTMRVGRAMNKPTNKVTSWRNKKTGARYRVAPTSDTMSMNGYSNCRKFHTSETYQGKTMNTDGVACLQNNGTWKVIANS